MSSDKPEIDIANFLNKRQMSKFNYGLVIISCLTTFFDGLDVTMISFAAPYLRDELKLSNYALGNVFSAGIIGTVLSGFIMAYFGDRIGRRPTLIGATIWFGVFTVATAWAQTYETLLILRFLVGLGIGGILPISLVLNIEYAPLTERATVGTLITIGYSVGATLAGPLSVWLAPRYGWQAAFLFGGFSSLACALLLWWNLPESIRFLASKRRQPEVIAHTLNRLKPDFGAGAAYKFVLSDELEDPEPFYFRKLFAGNLRWLTPVIWLSYLASTMGNYFTTNWGPTLYEGLQLSRSSSAFVASGAAIMSSILGLFLMRFTDRFGPIAISIYPALAVPLFLLIGLVHLPPSQFVIVLIASITLLGAAHVSLYGIMGMFYPSAIRSNGAGWASSIAKAGGAFSPMIGAVLLSSGMPLTRIFAILAICPVLVVFALVVINLITRRHKSFVDASSDHFQYE